MSPVPDTTPAPAETAPPKTDADASQPNTGSQEDAYNPETGEINWDCPCIAGMTKPPCGETFKEAFSCFVYSTQEPKGIDCVEQFRKMQSCFAEYPEIYGAEEPDVDDDEEEEEEDKKKESILAVGEESTDDKDKTSL